MAVYCFLSRYLGGGKMSEIDFKWLIRVSD